MEMYVKLPLIYHNITKFNDWVYMEIAKLISRGQASNLLTYLWKAYLLVTYKKFVAYIQWLKDEYDEGRIIYTSTYEKYDAQEENGICGQLSEE